MKKILQHNHIPENNVPSHSTLFSYALKRCITRPHAPQEIVALLEKKFGPTYKKEYAHTLSRLEELGYTGEMIFAKALLKNRLLYKNKGLHFISRELQTYGISSQTIQELLPEYLNDEEESLERAFEKKLSTLYKVASLQKKKEKLLSHLQRRGFSVQQIMKYLHSRL